MRNFSVLAVQQALALQAENAWLFLLAIRNPDTGETFRYVNDTVAVTSQGLSYEPYPFKLQLTIDNEENLPQAELELDNVDRALMPLIRGALAPPQVNVRVILSSTPDVIEYEIAGLVLLEVTYNAYSISGTLILDDLLNMRYPAETISLPAGYLGLFRQ